MFFCSPFYYLHSLISLCAAAQIHLVNQQHHKIAAQAHDGVTAQTDALGSVNASLRERYIGAASTRPCLVFPQLLKTAQFHISKSAKQHPGYDIRFSRLVSEIMDGMTVFPPVLSLEDQGRFMLGYYHQNNALYQKKTADDAEN